MKSYRDEKFMSKKYTVKDWLDCKVAITFNNKEELERFAEVVKPHGIKWRTGKAFGYGFKHDLQEVLLGFRKGEERIASLHPDGDDRYTCINFKDLDLASKQEIHITTDGIKNVYGVLKENGKVVKKTMAKCHPSDTFDFEIGVATVMDRLLEKAKEAEKVVEVKREAKKGEYVKVVDRECGHHFEIGEIVQCICGCSFKDSTGDWWDLCSDEYVVLEGYTPSKEKKVDEFKVGDMVEVVNCEYAYPAYGRWLGAVGYSDLSSHFVVGKEPKVGCRYKVVAVGEHCERKGEGTLYGIQNLDTTQVFIIGKKGIKKV